MYDFHYNFIKAKYGEKAILLFSDTDSLCYLISTEDVYEDLFEHRDFFDNSDYPKSSKFFFNDNKKVIGKFKDEAAGKIILEFVGEKPKMYSYITEIETKPIKICGKTYGKITKRKESKTAKGVKKVLSVKKLNINII